MWREEATLVLTDDAGRRVNKNGRWPGILGGALCPTALARHAGPTPT